MKEKKCPRCYGFGWYPIGRLTPIGELDSQDWGNKVIKCPWCGKGFVSKGKEYEALLNAKEEEEKKE